MNLKELDLNTFMNAIIKINQLMTDEKSCNSLLNKAKKDTPIIDELLAEINNLFGHEDSPEKEKGVTTAQRDLTVLLALREIHSCPR